MDVIILETLGVEIFATQSLFYLIRKQQTRTKLISWHISVVHWKNDDGYWMYRTFVHVFEQSTQSSTTVTAILKHVLQEIHEEMPEFDGVFIRSDNARCYKSSTTIASIPTISSATGIKILRWSFSEAQAGKGPCDQKFAKMKK